MLNDQIAPTIRSNLRGTLVLSFSASGLEEENATQWFDRARACAITHVEGDDDPGGVIGGELDRGAEEAVLVVIGGDESRP